MLRPQLGVWICLGAVVVPEAMRVRVRVRVRFALGLGLGLGAVVVPEAMSVWNRLRKLKLCAQVPKRSLRIESGL